LSQIRRPQIGLLFCLHVFYEANEQINEASEQVRRRVSFVYVYALIGELAGCHWKSPNLSLISVIVMSCACGFLGFLFFVLLLLLFFSSGSLLLLVFFEKIMGKENEIY
jgi:predicted permease